LGAQDLQEAKDQLLVETSDMLRVPLFTAEALLRNHGVYLLLSLFFCQFAFYSAVTLLVLQQAEHLVC